MGGKGIREPIPYIKGTIDCLFLVGETGDWVGFTKTLLRSA
jgi:hypothetical protein